MNRAAIVSRYYQDPKTQGVTTWDPRADVFPGGLRAVQNATDWPQQLHNRYWAATNTYRSKYEFICDGRDGADVCVPNSQPFWDDLMRNKSETGMFMYLQDWLWVTFNRSQSLAENATLGRTWMMQMDHGARMSNSSIQFCMTYIRNLMQSVEMYAVTNGRVSGDYQPGNDDWDIGISSILAHALGIAPSKDDWWSSSVQKGFPSKYAAGSHEPHSRLHAAVASLSTGPVIPSDKIGASDVALIMRSCDKAGRLLSPDRPAVTLDSHFSRAAFGTAGTDPAGRVVATSLELGGLRFSFVLGVNLARVHVVRMSELGHDPTAILLAMESNASTPANVTGGGLSLSACGKTDFQLFTLAPVVGGFALLGERAKWVAVSRQRFSQLSLGSKGGSVVVSVQPGERVSVLWSTPGGTRESVCQADKGAAMMKATVDANGAGRCVSAGATSGPKSAMKSDDGSAQPRPRNAKNITVFHVSAAAPFASSFQSLQRSGLRRSLTPDSSEARASNASGQST